MGLPNRLPLRWLQQPSPLLRYAAAAILSLAAQVARLPLHSATSIPYITFVPFIVFSAAYGGLGPGLVTTALCLAEAEFFATEPTWTFRVAAMRGWVGLFALAFTGVVVSVLSERVHRARRSDAAARDLATLLEQTYDAVFVWDLEHDRITFWNHGARRLYGYSRGEALGSAAHQLLATKFPTGLTACKTALLQTGYWEGELVHTCRDGRTLIVESRMAARQFGDGSLRVIEVTRDISERKRLEQAQQQLAQMQEQRERMLESIVQNSPACIALLRGANFVFEKVNTAYAELCEGVSMIGRTGMEVWPDAAPMIYPILTRVRESGTAYHATSTRMPRRHTVNGPLEDRFFDLSYVPLAGPDGDIRVLSTAIEVTGYKRVEEKLQQTIVEKERALAEKTVLLKEVHHRVKNNLAVISSLLRMKAHASGNSEVKAALEESQQRVASIALIHEQLYGTDRLDRIDFREYSLELVEQLRSSLIDDPERITIGLDVPQIEMGIHRAVPCALILNELVSNALKHAFPNQRSGAVSISLMESAPGYLDLAVEDNGVGLPAGAGEHETKSLGLSIVRILTKQLEGSLEEMAAAGGGTRYVLRMSNGSSDAIQ